MAAPHPQPSTARTAAAKASQWLGLLALLLCGALAPLAQAAGPQRSAFDHLTTGFELLGQHRDLPCESCHANAVFKGTPWQALQVFGVPLKTALAWQDSQGRSRCCPRSSNPVVR